jgi:diacylglycerol kinase
MYTEGENMARPPSRERITDYSLGKFLVGFRYAFRGVWYMLRTQRNMQVHCLIGACAVALGSFLALARWEWLALILTITLVLFAEGVNTAIEAAVDVATSEYHPYAKIAKDAAAGAVLICAVGAVVVGCVVFLPHLLPIILLLIS